MHIYKRLSYLGAKLLVSLDQQLEGAETCHWYFFAVSYRIPKVIDCQSKINNSRKTVSNLTSDGVMEKKIIMETKDNKQETKINNKRATG